MRTPIMTKVQIHKLSGPKETTRYMNLVIEYSKVQLNGSLIGWIFM